MGNEEDVNSDEGLQRRVNSKDIKEVKSLYFSNFMLGVGQLHAWQGQEGRLVFLLRQLVEENLIH